MQPVKRLGFDGSDAKLDEKRTQVEEFKQAAFMDITNELSAASSSLFAAVTV